MKKPNVTLALEAIDCWKEGKLSARYALTAIELALKPHTSAIPQNGYNKKNTKK